MSRAAVKAKVRSSRTPESSASSPRAAVWALLAILALALLTDLVFYGGFFSSDDLQYSRAALQIAETGRLSYLTIGTIRLGIVLPLALVARLSQQNCFVMTMFFALFHLLVVVGTYWVGRLLHGFATGLLAAGLIAVCPLAAVFATMILPDHAATALMLFSTGVLLIGLSLAGTRPASRGSLWALAAAGVLFGLSMTAKVVAIIMLPVFLALILVSARRISLRQAMRLALFFLAGLAVVGVLYCAAFRASTGLWSPLHDSSIVSRVGSLAERVADKPYSTTTDRLQRLLSFATSSLHLGLLRWAIPVTLIVYPFLRRRSWFLYLAVIWLCCYMTWGTFNPTRYAPPPMQIRYFIFVLPFLTIMVAHLTVLLGGWAWRRVAGVGPLRYAALGAAALGCLVVVVTSYQRMDRLAGNLYFSPVVGGVRYALDFAALSDDRPVVLSYWLSARTGLGLPSATPYLMTSKRTTGIGDVADLLTADGFLYLDCYYDHRENRVGPRELSPLDSAVQEALAGQNPQLSVQTVGVFSQFARRSAGLQYLYGGMSDAGGLRRSKPLVYLREVTAASDGHAAVYAQ